MVNSGSFDSNKDQDGKTCGSGEIQDGDAAIGSADSGDAADVASKSDCSKTADSDQPSDIEPINTLDANEEKASLCCSLPLEKVQGVLTTYSAPADAAVNEDKPKSTRKLLCLYCDRSFVSVNLRQKHVERVHSAKPTRRRVSARRQNQLSATPCVHCDKLNSTEHTLNDLFRHLVQEHSAKYFGCLACEERFLSITHLKDHNSSKHPAVEESDVKHETPATPSIKEVVVDTAQVVHNVPSKLTRSKLRNKTEEQLNAEPSLEISKQTDVKGKKKSKLKELRSKKITVKTSKIALKRSKRLQAQAKELELQKKRRDKKLPVTNKAVEVVTTKQPEKTKPSCINPYPEFDNYYRVKKITDHSIDNLKISSLTFDDVFDKTFFNRVKCNIEENLLHHIDGKLFKNEESESRISNFEKVSSTPQEIQSSSSENYGCELSLNAITPVASLSLNSQFGEDFESQIEYGSKPSKKKAQTTKKDEVHYKYFTRRKYQASILQQKENRDLSKLDMWTQMLVKERQEKIINNKKTAKEFEEYTSGYEYKNKMKRVELNRILDRRGPFEDLKEEASKKAAFDKLNLSSGSDVSQEVFTDVREVINEILNKVFETIQEDECLPETSIKEIDHREIPAYLDLRRKTSSTQEEIDKSDRIALICSSQETENFELPTNTIRGKNELVELTGEWARNKMYICAACGGKFSNMKYLLEHRSIYHQNVWVQFYEFVGNQGELYRHLSIPGLGKVGVVEDTVQSKQWKRSVARTCTKCGKQCNSLGELHRHILECGGDWTWMLARKKVKYRPFGAKSRRKKRGFIPRVPNKQKTESTDEKKIYKKPTYQGPRQRPSDADTIQRMLANLPAKRSRKNLISLRDVVFKSRKNNKVTTKTQAVSKIKCRQVISNKQNLEASTSTLAPQRNSRNQNIRTLRSLNKVLSSRILDINSSLIVKRKFKAIQSRKSTNTNKNSQTNSTSDENNRKSSDNSIKVETSTLPLSEKRRSPKKNTNSDSKQTETENEELSKIKKKPLTRRILANRLNNIKNFFPIKKKSISVQKTLVLEDSSNDSENLSKSRARRKIREFTEEYEEKSEFMENLEKLKKNKRGGLKGFVRALSLRKRNSMEENQNKNSKKLSTTEEILPTDVKGSTKKAGRPKRNITSAETKVSEDKRKDTVKNKEVKEEENVSKKRKFQRNIRNVVKKVKKLKTSKAANESPSTVSPKNLPKETQEQPFLGPKNAQQDIMAPEKVAVPAEVKENIQGTQDIAPTADSMLHSKENPPIPETIFNLTNNEEKSLQAKGELNFDSKPDNDTQNTVISEVSEVNQNDNSTTEDLSSKTCPVNVDTTMKVNMCSPMVSPNIKGKIKKPTKGLNDCIAMLTSKLQQKEDNKSSSLESLFSTSSTASTEPFVESRPLLDNCMPPVKQKPECMLKIPTFRIDKSPIIEEETALDLSKKSLSSPNLVFPHSSGFVSGNSIDNTISRVIEEVIQSKCKEVLPEKLALTPWPSLDSIFPVGPLNIFKKPPNRRNNYTTRTNVDDTIDFVVNSSSDWFDTKHGVATEKNKFAKKTKKKRHSDDGIIKDIIFGKDKLMIAPSASLQSLSNLPFLAKIKENELKESAKAAQKQKFAQEKCTLPKSPTVLENFKDSQCPVLSKTPNLDLNTTLSTGQPRSEDASNNIPLQPTSQSIENEPPTEKQNDVVQPVKTDKEEDKNVTHSIDLNLSEESGLIPTISDNKKLPTDDNISPNSSDLVNNSTTDKCTESDLSHLSEDAKKAEQIIQQPAKRGKQQKGKGIRSKNKTVKKKPLLKTESIKNPVLETNIDDVLNTTVVENEIKEAATLTCSDNSSQLNIPNVGIDLQNEPILLENKILEPIKPPLSDSEDELPLAVIAKQDEHDASNKNISQERNSQESVKDSNSELNKKEPPNMNTQNPLNEIDSPLLNEDIVTGITTDSLKENIEQGLIQNVEDNVINNSIKNTAKVKKPLAKRRRKIKFGTNKRKSRFKNLKLSRVVEPPNDEDKITSLMNVNASSFGTDQDITNVENLEISSLKLSGTDDKSVEQKTSENLIKNDIVPIESKQKIAEALDAVEPVKVFINSQRTRRKSKSSKKTDKLDNELFKDFSLVINKKTKRIPPTSIVDDSVCEDILSPNLNICTKPNEEKAVDVTQTDESCEFELNDSVEEMDMEIEDIPVSTSIIERDTEKVMPVNTHENSDDPNKTAISSSIAKTRTNEETKTDITTEIDPKVETVDSQKIIKTTLSKDLKKQKVVLRRRRLKNKYKSKRKNVIKINKNNFSNISENPSVPSEEERALDTIDQQVSAGLSDLPNNLLSNKDDIFSIEAPNIILKSIEKATNENPLPSQNVPDNIETNSNMDSSFETSIESQEYSPKPSIKKPLTKVRGSKRLKKQDNKIEISDLVDIFKPETRHVEILQNESNVLEQPCNISFNENTSEISKDPMANFNALQKTINDQSLKEAQKGIFDDQLTKSIDTKPLESTSQNIELSSTVCSKKDSLSKIDSPSNNFKGLSVTETVTGNYESSTYQDKTTKRKKSRKEKELGNIIAPNSDFTTNESSSDLKDESQSNFSDNQTNYNLLTENLKVVKKGSKRYQKSASNDSSVITVKLDNGPNDFETSCSEDSSISDIHAKLTSESADKSKNSELPLVSLTSSDEITTKITKKPRRSPRQAKEVKLKHNFVVQNSQVEDSKFSGSEEPINSILADKSTTSDIIDVKESVQDNTSVTTEPDEKTKPCQVLTKSNYENDIQNIFDVSLKKTTEKTRKSKAKEITTEQNVVVQSSKPGEPQFNEREESLKHTLFSDKTFIENINEVQTTQSPRKSLRRAKETRTTQNSAIELSEVKEPKLNQNEVPLENSITPDENTKRGVNEYTNISSENTLQSTENIIKGINEKNEIPLVAANQSNEKVTEKIFEDNSTEIIELASPVSREAKNDSAEKDIVNQSSQIEDTLNEGEESVNESTDFHATTTIETDDVNKNAGENSSLNKDVVVKKPNKKNSAKTKLNVKRRARNQKTENVQLNAKELVPALDEFYKSNAETTINEVNNDILKDLSGTDYSENATKLVIEDLLTEQDIQGNRRSSRVKKASKIATKQNSQRTDKEETVQNITDIIFDSLKQSVENCNVQVPCAGNISELSLDSKNNTSVLLDDLLIPKKVENLVAGEAFCEENKSENILEGKDTTLKTDEKPTSLEYSMKDDFDKIKEQKHRPSKRGSRRTLNATDVNINTNVTIPEMTPCQVVLEQAEYDKANDSIISNNLTTFKNKVQREKSNKKVNKEYDKLLSLSELAEVPSTTKESDLMEYESSLGKSKRTRKVVDYNEDVLEKNAIEMAKGADSKRLSLADNKFQQGNELSETNLKKNKKTRKKLQNEELETEPQTVVESKVELNLSVFDFEESSSSQEIPKNKDVNNKLNQNIQHSDKLSTESIQDNKTKQATKICQENINSDTSTLTRISRRLNKSLNDQTLSKVTGNKIQSDSVNITEPLVIKRLEEEGSNEFNGKSIAKRRNKKSKVVEEKQKVDKNLGDEEQNSFMETPDTSFEEYKIDSDEPDGILKIVQNCNQDIFAGNTIQDINSESVADLDVFSFTETSNELNSSKKKSQVNDETIQIEKGMSDLPILPNIESLTSTQTAKRKHKTKKNKVGKNDKLDVTVQSDKSVEPTLINEPQAALSSDIDIVTNVVTSPEPYKVPSLGISDILETAALEVNEFISENKEHMNKKTDKQPKKEKVTNKRESTLTSINDETTDLMNESSEVTVRESFVSKRKKSKNIIQEDNDEKQSQGDAIVIETGSSKRPRNKLNSTEVNVSESNLIVNETPEEPLLDLDYLTTHNSTAVKILPQAKRAKKQRNYLDIDVANILSIDSMGDNRRSPRKKKTAETKALEIVECKTTESEVSSANQLTFENKNELLSACLTEQEADENISINLAETIKEIIEVKNSENNADSQFSPAEDDSATENQSVSNTPVPFIEGINSFSKSIDNEKDNFASIMYPTNTELSNDTNDNAFLPLIEDNSNNINSSNEVESVINNSADFVDRVSVTKTKNKVKSKQRKNKKSKGKVRGNKDTEIIKAPITVAEIVDDNIEKNNTSNIINKISEKSYQQDELEKITITNLLMCSPVPPQTNDESLKITDKELEPTNTSNFKDFSLEFDEVNLLHSSDIQNVSAEKSQKNKEKAKSNISIQNVLQIFDSSTTSSSLLSKNLNFTALKNALDTIAKPSRKSKSKKSHVFTDIEPLTEIITSSEMDIAPVLDEIDKSLESDELYDFNEEEMNKKPLKETKAKGNKKKNKLRSQSSSKTDNKKESLINLDQQHISSPVVPVRRNSKRSAKDKALEHIHEEVLAESSDNEIKQSRRSKSLSSIKDQKGEHEKLGKSTLTSNTSTFPEECSSTVCDANTNKLIISIKAPKPVPGTDIKESEKMETSLISETGQHQDDNNVENKVDSNAAFEKNEFILDDGQELRRSRRGSRKVASYNENDLIDPLIDALESSRNRTRKDKPTDKILSKKDTHELSATEKTKLNSEELFDLLKNSSYETESINILKPRNAFLERLNEPSVLTDFQGINDDEFDIREKPSLVLNNDLEKVKDIDKIYEFTDDSAENSDEMRGGLFIGKSKKKQNISDTNIKSVFNEAADNSLSVSSNDLKNVPEEPKPKTFESGEKPNYCDICKKSFIRVENLIKHKTTLTHISKLSEIEAKAAEEKLKLESEKEVGDIPSDPSLEKSDSLKDQLEDILQSSNEFPNDNSFEKETSLHQTHSLNLVDIISDVLNKPVLDSYSSEKAAYSALSIQNSVETDIRRYKSLGERKSFDSESQLSGVSTPLSESFLQNNISKTTILENQINLLENIIGSNLDNVINDEKPDNDVFVDEMSSVSNNSNISTIEINSGNSNASLLNRSSTNTNSKSHNNFIKPVPYEEMSEDSINARVYEDSKLRKTLNRDEELFLECCSLLKSGSEVSNSNYSKKALTNYKESNNEADWLENKKLTQTVEEAHEYSDNSRTPTPLGDTYDDDASNSNTISSNWDLKSQKTLKNKSFSFEKVINKEETDSGELSFGDMLSKGLKHQFESATSLVNREDVIDSTYPSPNAHYDDKKDDSDSSSGSKKIITKGARKVFEGLKVSIPTEELNLDILNYSPLGKKPELSNVSPLNQDQTATPKPRSTRKSKPVKKSQVGSNLLFKVNKKKTSPQVSKTSPNENQDVYAFDDTQDNVFAKPAYCESKEMTPSSKKSQDIQNCDVESLGYTDVYDDIGADVKSVSSVTSSTVMSTKKEETDPETITKKKYKIMGKIFKNAAKSKMDEIDEELRHIPEIPEMDNLELVENYVRSCQRIISPLPPPTQHPEDIPKKPKMTEEEMNMLFDQLLGKEAAEICNPIPEKQIKTSTPKPPKVRKTEKQNKTGENKKKAIKPKGRKRVRGNSESSDDEFNINKTTKKRTNKKNNEDSGINLELELKECIGVASRKSQRKCTSGKQNVLVEYWSSDEEAFEAMLESQRLQSKNEEDEKRKKETDIKTVETPNKNNKEVPDLSENKQLDMSEKLVVEPPQPSKDKVAKSLKTSKKRPQKPKKLKRPSNNESPNDSAISAMSNRRKRAAVHPLYHWSSSSEDDSQSDLIEVKPVREEDEEDRPIQHGWIVGDSPKKLVTMLALIKGKKTETDGVKEQGKRRTSNAAS